MITVVAVCLFDEEDRILTVRKYGTTKWMLPGGKPENSETALETAVREISEELNVDLDSSQLTQLGVFHSIAANEGEPLKATVFTTNQRINPKIQAEIAEMRWVSLSSSDPEQAPLNTELVFPLIQRQRKHFSQNYAS